MPILQRGEQIPDRGIHVRGLLGPGRHEPDLGFHDCPVDVPGHPGALPDDVDGSIEDLPGVIGEHRRGGAERRAHLKTETSCRHRPRALEDRTEKATVVVDAGTGKETASNDVHGVAAHGAVEAVVEHQHVAGAAVEAHP